MPKALPKRSERADQGMARLQARVQQLHRRFLDPSNPDGVPRTGEAIRAFCRETNVSLDAFTRLVGVSRRAVATWLAGDRPGRANQRNLSEVTRLFSALAEVVPAPQIGRWLEAPNPAFEGSTPLQVIERGESDRLWRMVWELRGGNSGD